MSKKRSKILLAFIVTFVFAGSGFQVEAQSVEDEMDGIEVIESMEDINDSTTNNQVRENGNDNHVLENPSVNDNNSNTGQQEPQGQAREPGTDENDTEDSTEEAAGDDDADPHPASSWDESDTDNSNWDIIPEAQDNEDALADEEINTSQEDGIDEEINLDGQELEEDSEPISEGIEASDTDDSGVAAQSEALEEATTDSEIKQDALESTAEETTSNTHRFPSLTIGETPNERYFTWYSDSFEQGYFEISVANDTEDFTNSRIIEGETYTDNNTQSLLNAGFPDLSHTQVHITDLERNSEYMYRFWNGAGEKSDVYHFETHAPGDFSFITIGDAQIGSSGDIDSDAAGWEETMNQFPEINADPNFILSVGDQVEWAWSEEEYAAFIEQEGLNEETLVPVIGNHDTYNPAFSEHFALPNVQEEGQTLAGSNYYFMYNDALFTILNLENTNFEEHERTLQTAIYNTQEFNPKWRIVSFHRSLYSPANHSDTIATRNRRENMAPLMTQYDIDLVLSGHDHAYARSHVMDGTRPIIEWDEDGNAPNTYVDPDGVIYITLNSSSGSKYYDLQDDYDYLAVRNQEYARNLSNVTVTDDYIEVVTYRAEDLSIVDEVRIYKTDENQNIPDAERYILEADQVVIFEDDDLPSAAEGVANRSELSGNTAYNWVIEPDTSVVGSTTGRIEVIHPDGTAVEFDVAVEIIENREDALEEQDFGTMQPLDPTENTIEISVITDTHILANELISNHPEYLDMLNVERKLFTQSEEAFREAIRKIEENNSQVIFVPRDLTRDNERASYEVFVEVMEDYVQNGEDRRVFVVPGNHDINNPAAYDYNVPEGEEPISLPFFTPAEFMDMFGPLVYDQALDLYKDSVYFEEYLAEVNENYDRDPEDEYYAHGYLTYVSRVDMEDNGKNGLTVIGIDSAIYSADSAAANQDVRETGGLVTEPQMRWIVDHINAAHARNDVVALLSHHAFIPHFSGQHELLDEFILRNWDVPFESTNPQVDGKTPLEVIADSGVSYLFTGHMHANDISSFTTNEGNTLYDIETGSLVTHPVPVRHMTLTNQIDSRNTGHMLDIRTDYIEYLEFLNADKDMEVIEDFGQYSWEFLIDADFLAAFVMDYLNEIPPTKELIGSLILPEGVPAEFVTPALVELIKDNVGTSAEPILNEQELVLGITLSVYWDEITNGDGEKLALDVDTGLLGTHNLMVTEDNIGLFFEELFVSADENVLQNEEYLYTTVRDLAQLLLDYPVVIDANGHPILLQEVAEQAYVGHLAGEEFSTRPEWMSTVVYRFNNENVLFDVIEYMEPALIATVEDILSRVTFDLGGKIEVDGGILEQITSAPVQGIVGGVLPSDLDETIDLIGIDYQTLLSELLSGIGVVENEINAFNPILADIVESFADELSQDQAQYAYLFDNDTTLAKQLTPLNYNGEIVFTSPTEFTFVSDFNQNAIEKMYLSIDGTVYELAVPNPMIATFAASTNPVNNMTFDLENLGNGLQSFENGNQVAMRVIYPNEFGNMITLTSPLFEYMELTRENPLEHGVTYVYSPSVPVGEEEILFNGQEGTEVVMYIVNHGDEENPENWIEISRAQTTNPIDQIIAIGFEQESNDELVNRVEELERQVQELQEEQREMEAFLNQLLEQEPTEDIDLSPYLARINELEQRVSDLEQLLADLLANGDDTEIDDGENVDETEETDNIDEMAPVDQTDRDETIIIPDDQDNDIDSSDKVSFAAEETPVKDSVETISTMEKRDEIVSATSTVETGETLPKTSAAPLAITWIGLFALVSGLGLNVLSKKKE
jgi:Rib/alpha/Esp surface antigen-like repeat protein